MKYKDFVTLNKYKVSTVTTDETYNPHYYKRTMSEKDYWAIVNAIRSLQTIYLYNTNIVLKDYDVENLELSMPYSIDQPHSFPDFRAELLFFDIDYILRLREYFPAFEVIFSKIGKPCVRVSLRPEQLDIVPFAGSKAGKLLYAK